MSSDAASVFSFSSSTPLTGATKAAKPGLLSKLFKRSPSPTSRTSSPPKSSEDIFREIMALNARHGDPSVQAYSVKATPRARAEPAAAPERSSAPLQSSKDIFHEVMRTNAKHGHPGVQAHTVR